MKPPVRLTAWALVGLGLVVGCTRQDRYERPLTPVKVRPAEASSASDSSRYSATIRPYSQVDLAFKVGGYVREILQGKGVDGRKRDAQEGDRVAKGAVLARLRGSDYAAKLNQAKSQLAEAQPSAEQARLDLDRAANLSRAQSMTEADYDAAKARFEITRAKLDAAKQVLREAEIALQDSALKAPADAVILKRSIEIGTLVAPGTVAFVLADTSSMKAVFGVPDVTLQELTLGGPLTITVEALAGGEFPGRITAISPSADPKSLAFEVEVTIPNPREFLKAGMIASAKIGRGQGSVASPVVPLSAIVRSRGTTGQYAVAVVEDRGGKQIARIRPVTLGQMTGNRIAVSTGLVGGEKVIVVGATMVADGEQVRTIE